MRDQAYSTNGEAMANSHAPISVVVVALGLILLSACAEKNDSRANTPLSLNTSPTPIEQIDQKVWQPPEPSAIYYDVRPTPTPLGPSPDTIIVYRTYGRTSDLMTITEKGVASVYDSWEVTWTLQLSTERVNTLRVLFDEARFFELQDFYPDPKPKAMATVDVGHSHAPRFEITYTKDGLAKTVSTKYHHSPDALGEVITSLVQVHREVKDKGVKQSSRPDLLVDYYLSGSKQRVWSMDIDVEGGISYGSGTPIAQMTPEEISELMEMFERANWFS